MRFMQKGQQIDASAFNSVVSTKSLFPPISKKNSNTGDFVDGITKTNTKDDLKKLKISNESCNVRTN